MQDKKDKQPEKGRRTLAGKGYLIVLALCLAAVGVTGGLLANTALRQQHTALSAAQSTARSNTSSSKAAVSSGTAGGAAADAFSEDDAAASAEAAAADAAAQVVVWPVNGDVLNGYSVESLAYNETTRDWRVHEGIDIAASDGEKVLAAKAGTVSAVYSDDSLGEVVVLNHNDGTSTLYGNLNEVPAVSVGDEVEAGTVLGSIGGTATTEVGLAPHLHFAVYSDGVREDPLDFLPAK